MNQWQSKDSDSAPCFPGLSLFPEILDLTLNRQFCLPSLPPSRRHPQLLPDPLFTPTEGPVINAVGFSTSNFSIISRGRGLPCRVMSALSPGVVKQRLDAHLSWRWQSGDSAV